jgi:hypothetical protein
MFPPQILLLMSTGAFLKARRFPSNLTLTVSFDKEKTSNQRVRRSAATELPPIHEMTRRDNSSRTDASRSRLRNASISSRRVRTENVWSAAIGASLSVASPEMRLVLKPARWTG